MNKVCIVIVAVLLNIIIGSSGTDLVTQLTNEKPVTTNSYIFDDREFQNLAHQVQHLKDATENMRLKIELNTFSIKEELAALRIAMTQDIKEMLAKQHTTEDCSKYKQIYEQLPQEFAKLKSEIVEEIRGTFVERHYNLSDHLSQVTHSVESRILSTVSSNIKSEIEDLKNILQPQINSLWNNVKNEITDLKDSLSTNMTNESHMIQKQSKSEIEDLKNILQAQINSLWTNVKNEITDLKDSLSTNMTNESHMIQMQSNSLATSVKGEIENFRDSLTSIEPQISRIANISQSIQTTVEGKLGKLENTPLQTEVSLTNFTKKLEFLRQPNSCAEAMQNCGESGIYKLRLPSSGLEPFNVYCLKDPENGPAWTVVQRRQDGSTDFNRNWEQYKNGFGDLNVEFFIGLDHLHALTNQDKPQELWIKLTDWEGASRSAKYSTIQIGDEASKYFINLKEYSGDADDSIVSDRPFSTYDSDNDSSDSNLAEIFKGGWWFWHGAISNLNGEYLRGELPHNKENYVRGITWYRWRGSYYSYKYAHMAIRTSN